MKIKLLIVFLFFTSLVFSQKIIIQNADTNQGIAYANVVLKKDTNFVKAFYADTNGSVSISQNVNYNKVIVSCIGFNAINVNGKITNDTLIKLTNKNIELDEIVINKNKDEKFIIPDIKKSKRNHQLYYGSETALFLKNTYNTEVKIEKLRLNVNKIKNKCTIRIKFYEYGALQPGKELFSHNIIKQIDANSKGYLIFDLSEYNMLLPKSGAFVSIEGLEGLEIMDISDNDTTDVNKLNFRFKTLLNHNIPFYTKNFVNNNAWIENNIFYIANYKLSFNEEIDTKYLFIPDINVSVSVIE